MLIDTHAHLNFKAFKTDHQQIIDQCLSQDIHLINVGSQYSTSQRAVDLAEKNKVGVYAAVGLHPVHLIKQTYSDVIDGEEISFTTQAETFDYQKYKTLANHPKVVALGETGFDFFHCDKNEVLPKQQETLDQHIKLSQELDKPLIIHCRDGYSELVDFLRNYSNLKGVIHCYGGFLKQAQEFLKMGFYLGFTGIITFKNAKELQAVASRIPLEKILVETDCPYLAPEPYRGKRNQPDYVKCVAQKIADLKNLTLEQVASRTTINAQELFLTKIKKKSII